MRKLLRVAYCHFIINGVEGANIKTIAREAGVSRQMIHNRFGSKEAFFQKVVHLGNSGMADRFQFDSKHETRNPWELFNFFGNQIYEIMVDPGNVDIFRLITVASSRHPEIGSAHERAIRSAYSLFAKHLRAAGQEHGITIGDPKGSARDFLALITGLARPVIEGATKRPGPRVQAREIAAIVDRFLRGVGFEEPASET